MRGLFCSFSSRLTVSMASYTTCCCCTAFLVAFTRITCALLLLHNLPSLLNAPTPPSFSFRRTFGCFLLHVPTTLDRFVLGPSLRCTSRAHVLLLSVVRVFVCSRSTGRQIADVMTLVLIILFLTHTSSARPCPRPGLHRFHCFLVPSAHRLISSTSNCH